MTQQQRPTLTDAATYRSGPTQERLEKVWGLARSLDSTALLAVHRDRIILNKGGTAKKTNSHSLRKSLINALIGLAVDQGRIDLDSSLADLGIDDRTPLSAVEKTATVKDLLMSKSGVYLPAASESLKMKAGRPARHAHLPGTHFYYNNWDFNVLGTIFSQATGRSIGGAFGDWIAGPLGLVDYRIEDVHLFWEKDSRHPSYPFYITARDLARFGQLYLHKGIRRGKRIIPAWWVQASTTAYSFNGETGYGYLWWTFRNLAYFGAGFGGQYLIVVPSRDLVLVNRVDSGRPGSERRDWLASGKMVTSREMLKILNALLDLLPDKNTCSPTP